MHRRGVVGNFRYGVGLVLADAQARLGVQQFQHDPRQAQIPVEQHAGMPLPRHAAVDRCETMHRDQRRGASAAGVQRRGQVVMIGPEHLPHAGFALCIVQADIAGNHRRLADFGDRGRVAGRPVAVDHQAGIGLPDQRRIQRLGDLPRHLPDADIPADMAREFPVRQTQRIQAARNAVGRVVAGQEERRRRFRMADHDRVRLVGSEKGLHGRPDVTGG